MTQTVIQNALEGSWGVVGTRKADFICQHMNSIDLWGQRTRDSGSESQFAYARIIVNR